MPGHSSTDGATQSRRTPGHGQLPPEHELPVHVREPRVGLDVRGRHEPPPLGLRQQRPQEVGPREAQLAGLRDLAADGKR